MLFSIFVLYITLSVHRSQQPPLLRLLPLCVVLIIGEGLRWTTVVPPLIILCSTCSTSAFTSTTYPRLRIATSFTHTVLSKLSTAALLQSSSFDVAMTMSSCDNSDPAPTTTTSMDVRSTIPGKNGNVLNVTWEVQVAQDILQRAARSQRKPYMVAVAGVPGSGKSSSAEILTYLINHNRFHLQNNNGSNEEEEFCLCVPADGYHYSKETLHRLQTENQDDTLLYRRGAPDTFDVSALIRDLQQIRNHNTINNDDDSTISSSNKIASFPGFDHAMGDPVPKQHIYQPSQHSIIIMEGLYLLYDQYLWENIQQYFDYTIYIRTNTIDECMERVKERNVCIPGYTPEEIYSRVDIVDRNNAILIDESSPSRAHYVVSSSASP
jgi:pantothenate kinase